MNEKLYVALTRILLAVAVTIAAAGSILFLLLEDVIRDMPFSGF